MEQRLAVYELDGGVHGCTPLSNLVFYSNLSRRHFLLHPYALDVLALLLEASNHVCDDVLGDAESNAEVIPTVSQPRSEIVDGLCDEPAGCG